MAKKRDKNSISIGICCLIMMAFHVEILCCYNMHCALLFKSQHKVNWIPNMWKSVLKLRINLLINAWLIKEHECKPI